MQTLRRVAAGALVALLLGVFGAAFWYAHTRNKLVDEERRDVGACPRRPDVAAELQAAIVGHVGDALAQHREQPAIVGELVARVGGVAWKGAAELASAPDEREC